MRKAVNDRRDDEIASERALVVTPAPGQVGSALLTVSVSDGSASTNIQFTLTVNAFNDPPTISDIAEATGAHVFHAGTALHGERLVTNGGRIFAVTGVGPTVDDARERAYRGVDSITFDGMRYRSDIAAAAAAGVTPSLG